MATRTKSTYDVVGNLMAYEAGELSDEDTLKFYGELIQCGLAWSLQGSYGRQAESLIEAGLVNELGEVDWYQYRELVDGGEYA